MVGDKWIIFGCGTVALWHSCCNLFIASALCRFKECQECQSVIRLFDKGHILLDPSYIYMDIDDRNFYFIYYPFLEDKDADEEGPKVLFNYMMEHLDNDDDLVTESVYRLMELVENQHIDLKEAVEFFLNEYDEKEESAAVYREEEKKDDLPVYIPEYEEKKRSLWEIIKGLFITSEDTPEEVDTEGFLKDYAYQNSVSYDERKDDDSTVFIPWMDNSEHKLYGIGRGNKNHIDLKKCPLTVGKLADMADMVISEESVSRLHVKFTHKNNHYFMQDLNSTNGTYRNGMRLNPNECVPIETGDEIGIGKLKFIYR